MEGAGVPAILAYRGAEKFAGLVPVVDEIPDDADLSAVTLQQVLRRYVWIVTLGGLVRGRMLTFCVQA